MLAYSTYLGGSGTDGGLGGGGIAVDASGSAYVVGSTQSADFPTTPGAFQTTFGGGGCGPLGCTQHAFLSKLNATGSALLYSTYLGGSGYDGGSGVAVDGSGNAYVTGSTNSSDFPTTPGAFQRQYHGGSGLCTGGVCSNAFVSKLNAMGSGLVYSTYLGGSVRDGASGIAVDTSGNAYLTGNTVSFDFPTTPGAFQTTSGGGFYGDAFVSKLNAGGSALVYSTFLGGSSDDWGSGIAVGASGSAHVTGATDSSDFPTTPGAFQTSLAGTCFECTNAFVTKLNAAGSALVYSTYLGGSNSDGGFGIAVDASSNAYVTGSATSSNFPVTPGAFQTIYGGNGDAFISKLNPADSTLVYSTYLGGSNADWGGAVAVDSSGNAYVTGTADSSDFPTTPGAFQSTCAGGSGYPSPCRDGFVSKLGAAGSALVYSTYLGGSNDEEGLGIALDASGNVCVTGWTSSSDFPTTPGAFQTIYGGNGDAFVTKFSSSSPGLVLAPSSVTFPLLRTVGTTSLAHAVRLTKVGSGQLDITSITVTGPDSGDFAQTNNCPPTVAAGGSCLITVTFTPTAQGVRTASVSITDTAIGSPQTVPLTGRGTFLQWAPRSIFMGDLPVGTSSPARTVKLTNVGRAPITVFSIRIGGVNPGDFSETNNCGSSLKTGASCTIEVTFTPTAVGGRLGHVAIRDSAFGGTHVVGLLGKGT